MKLFWRFVSSLVPRARRGERGSILILGALSAVIVIGSAGLAVDVARLYAAKAEISRTVDAAALAGVLDFNGQASGQTTAQNTAYAYLTANDPSITVSCPTAASCITPDGTTNKMTIKVSKSVKLYFLSLFGISSASVYGHATAGFQDQTIDAVMVVDSTLSMNGAPLTNAKTAATNFKNSLLGSNPSGNVYVGIAPLRGCYRPTPNNIDTDCVYNTAQAGTTYSNCSGTNQSTTYVQGLTSTSSSLDTAITAVSPGCESATNVCTGLGKGYEVLNSTSPYPTGHQSNPKNRQYMVLLSDGDNVYFGDYTYVAGPPKSPNTFSIGASSYDCQPPNNCAGWGTPCFNGTFSGSGVTIASDGFESSSPTYLNGGNGWTAGSSWATSGLPLPDVVTTNTPQAGSRHARVANTGTITRTIDLSSYSAASMSFYAKTAGSWASTDHAYLEVSTTGGAPWAQLRDFTTANTSISYPGSAVSVDLSSYTGHSSVSLRFRANNGSNSKYLYVDSVNVTNTSSNGYLNGQDGQDYTSCTQTPVPRERQLDVETLNVANAIKAQNVEIYVVVFSACPDNTGSTVYNTAACGSPPISLASPPASGVGDTTTESTANTRLVKCIASSKAGTNDHYFYATNATDLPNIFTTIAAQIAHRLVD